MNTPTASQVAPSPAALPEGMSLRADLSRREVDSPEAATWHPAGQTGVHRRLLDRQGGEVARATSVVRYDPGARFPAHRHGGGEEILVLQGTFEDEHGAHPEGTYLRNPPGSAHAPFSQAGCLLFVKLCHFGPGDTASVRIDTRATPWRPGLVPGLSVMPLHEHDGVHTALVRWTPDTRFNSHVHPGGEEILVLQGTFEDEHGRYPAGTWLRNPCWSEHTPFTGPDGAVILVKTGHLGHVGGA